MLQKHFIFVKKRILKDSSIQRNTRNKQNKRRTQNHVKLQGEPLHITTNDWNPLLLKKTLKHSDTGISVTIFYSAGTILSFTESPSTPLALMIYSDGISSASIILEETLFTVCYEFVRFESSKFYELNNTKSFINREFMTTWRLFEKYVSRSIYNILDCDLFTEI